MKPVLLLDRGASGIMIRSATTGGGGRRHRAPQQATTRRQDLADSEGRPQKRTKLSEEAQDGRMGDVQESVMPVELVEIVRNLSERVASLEQNFARLERALTIILAQNESNPQTVDTVEPPIPHENGATSPASGLTSGSTTPMAVDEPKYLTRIPKHLPRLASKPSIANPRLKAVIAPKRIVRAEAAASSSAVPAIDAIVDSILDENPNEMKIAFDEKSKCFILSHPPKTPTFSTFRLIPDGKLRSTTILPATAAPFVSMQLRPEFTFNKKTPGIYKHMILNLFAHLRPKTFSINGTSRWISLEFENVADANKAIEMSGSCISYLPYAIIVRAPFPEWNSERDAEHRKTATNLN